MLQRKIKKLLRGSQRNKSYAQAGEDKILDFLFNTMQIRRIRYIDIGANDPINFNNTYLFYCKGGEGILIEPDPVFGKVLKKARPGDKILQAAISDKESSLSDFYVFDEPSINTLSKEEADLRVASGNFKLKEVMKIPLLRIEDIISKHMGGVMPQLISLDVEGVDYKVLSSFDFRTYPVPVWVVETCTFSENHIKSKVSGFNELMESRGYMIYADTYVNTIYVNKEWFFNYASKR